MSNDVYKTKEQLRAELQARLDAHFAEKGFTGDNFADAGRRMLPGRNYVNSMKYGGVRHSFMLDADDSYVCSGSEKAE
jgi:hypothetical protein